MKKIIIICLVLISQVSWAQPSQQLAPTPPMGWNSWNWFGKHQINETIVREVIDAMVANGLKDAGYKYVVVDGGWRDTTLTADGKLRPNPKRFPHGMKALADYAHSKGLKFGVHTVPGTNDCGGDAVGGFGHEKVQVQQFADWGLDFIKLDKCRYKPGWNEYLLKKTYFKWRKLLDESGRDIVLSISAYTFRDWYPGNCQMARTTGDIKAKIHGGAVFDHDPRSVMRIAEINNQSASYAGDGYWNDPDMLAVGSPGLTMDEQKVHFALWSIMSAPLMLGNDPRNMDSQIKAIITNKDAIAIDQDPTEQGRRIVVKGNTEIWAKHLKDGSQAVLMINRDEEQTQSITLPLLRLGMTGKVRVKNVYTQNDMGTYTQHFNQKLQPQSGLFLIVKPLD